MSGRIITSTQSSKTDTRGSKGFMMMGKPLPENDIGSIRRLFDMSIVRTIQCNACGFTLLNGTGTALYVKKPAGFLRKLFGLGDRKTIVPDLPVGKIPGGRGIPELLDEGRLGHSSAYFCQACNKVFQHDSDLEKTCTSCGCSDVKSVFEMVGQKCPKCSNGVFEDKRTGII